VDYVSYKIGVQKLPENAHRRIRHISDYSNLCH
jgi:hypothetical protein